MVKIKNPLKIAPHFITTQELSTVLHVTGCQACSLGFQPNINGCCVMRGEHTSKLMIVGEAPAKVEDATREPFTGPAGQLLDKIWRAAGMDTRDWYLTNVVLCRPVAPKGYGKQNLTPKAEQRKKCRPYLDAQIGLIQPSVIVTLGATATAAILNKPSIRMGDYRGKPITSLGILIEDSTHPETVTVGRPMVFPMLHPAAILHTSSKDPIRHQQYKEQTWQDVQKLKSILEERNLI